MSRPAPGAGARIAAPQAKSVGLALCALAGFLLRAAVVAQPAHAQQDDIAAPPATVAVEAATEATGDLEGPIDPTRYLLGPGDQLHVRVGGKQLIDHRIEITPDGSLILPEGPIIPLAGVSLQDAQTRIHLALQPYYREGRVQIHLLRLRTFGVYVVGSVKQPGMQRATAVTRASELITRAGGLFEDGSSRAITVTHADGKVESIDLGLFLSTGSTVRNPCVEAGDRIHIPPLRRTAHVGGAVNVPGDVEVIPGDSVATLIELVQGLSEDAEPAAAYLESYGGTPNRSTRVPLDLSKSADRRRPVRERDLLFVSRRPGWRLTRSVKVEGEVQAPGMHALPTDSLPLTEVIGMAGGFTSLASLNEAHVTRLLEDRPPDPEFERLKSLPSTDMTPDEHEYYMIKLRAQKQEMSVDFWKLFVEGDKTQNIYVQPGDEIFVPPLRSYVTLVGEVPRPGNIPYQSGMTAEQYLAHAGGFTERAARNKVAVIRAQTGEWVDNWKQASLGPGDTIWIPRKPRRAWGALALRTLEVTAQLATTYLVIDAALK